MNTSLLIALGGIGLFLLGMLIFTDGLKQLAGGALRRALARFTRGPVSGALTGAIATAVIQSSSATTVTAVGFVGAGLLTFTQALGIIFGANIGTTITGWLLAIIGFKLKLGLLVQPLLMVGVLLRLFGRGRLAGIGWALAGFSLLFIGIDMLQLGMEPLEGGVTPAVFPNDSYWGRFQLVFMGVALTLVTQSSSAGVATALVALGAGAISFPQAAAMVIGMDVGTTFTAGLAALGGSTAMRRTGYAHIVYNVLTGLMAFFLLDLYTYLVGQWMFLSKPEDAQIALVGFHTFFNGLGVVLVLPFTSKFAALIKRLVPETGPFLSRHLDDRLLKDSSAAADALIATVRDIALELFAILATLLVPNKWAKLDRGRLPDVMDAIEATRHFSSQIKVGVDQEDARRRHVAAMHVLDHLDRLSDRCHQETRIRSLQDDRNLRRLTALLQSQLFAVVQSKQIGEAEKVFDRLRTLFRKQRYVFRDQTVMRASNREIDAETTLQLLDSVRWLHRVAYHVWRICYHLALNDPALLRNKETPKVKEVETVLPASFSATDG